MIYTMTLNPALDYVMHPLTLDMGFTNRSSNEELHCGGNGINISTLLNELDVPSIAMGIAAGFTGDYLLRRLQEKGIASNFVILDRGYTRINVKLKADCESEINGQGPAISKEHLQQLFDKLQKLQEGDVLVLAGSIPGSLPSDIYEKNMQQLQGRQIMVVVDATRELLCNVLKYKPFLIKPNHIELGEIFGVELQNDQQIREYAGKLQERGARNVLVSMAGAGAILLDENGGFHRIAAPKGTVKNSVGAGDSMVAGFLAGYLQSGDYGVALKMGTATGSATAFSEGLATKPEAQALFDALCENE